MGPHPQPVVVLTGASKGLGLAVASILLGSLKATVVAISRTRTPQLTQLATSHPHDLRIIDCNVTDEPALSQAISSVGTDYGRIDALILNAAALDPVGRIEDSNNSLDKWRTHFDVNVFSLLTAIKAALPSLRQSPIGGRIVFVSSGAATGGVAGWGAYNASKAAMNSICRTLATEEKGVISVAVRPGKVDTSMQLQIREQGGSHMVKTVHESFVREHAEGKLLPPDVPGHVIAGLALRAPSALSGQFVSWDGDECNDFRKHV
ncbi:hypothetical protein OF83DRAFT_828574 [Amylostereum chailletii]|nr:hypothetical protein OF83DRAFT_828574 [Amylostereum chailletii]